MNKVHLFWLIARWGETRYRWFPSKIYPLVRLVATHDPYLRNRPVRDLWRAVLG